MPVTLRIHRIRRVNEKHYLIYRIFGTQRPSRRFHGVSQCNAADYFNIEHIVFGSLIMFSDLRNSVRCT